nr:hypothetical protein [Tanacetum cinerariifolium]
MEEINYFQQELDESLYQAWKRFKELLMKCPQHYLTEMQEVILFYNRLDVPTRQILDLRGRSIETSYRIAAIQAQLNNLGREIKKVNEKVYDAQVGCEKYKGPHYTKDCPLKEEGKTLEEAYYSKSMEDTIRKFMSESTKRHKENSNLIKEIQASMNAAIRNQRASTKTLEIQIGKMNKSRQTTVPFLSHLDNNYCEEEKGNYGPKFVKAYGASHINDTKPQKEKDPGSFTLLCSFNNICLNNALVDLGASDSDLKGIAENVLVGIGEFTFSVDFIILDIPEDIKVPLILKRPFLSTARTKIDVYKRKITLRVGEEKIIFKSVKPATSLIKRVYMISLRERMKLDLKARLIGETLVINRSLDPFLEDYIELNYLNKPIELKRNQGDDLMPTIEEGEVNVMTKEFHNLIMKDKMVYKGNNVVGALMNVLISVGNFSVVTDIVVLKNMDAYRDEGIGDVIFGEPFLREVVINARRLDGMITLYKGNDEVTYQMVQSHSRFKNHTNEQCNKIPPLLKVSEEDKKNGISHAY